MKHIYILEADPTEFGGIQQFVRNLASYLPSDKVTLLAYYGKLAHKKNVESRLLNVRDVATPGWLKMLSACWNWAYHSIFRNLALLIDIPVIRYNLKKLLSGDTLIVNSAFAMYLLCPRKVLRENRIILVQHTCPRMMKRNAYDFGKIFVKQKIDCFKKYVDTFVMLSPLEKKEFSRWLPLDNTDCRVIRHAMPFPTALSENAPRSVAVLARLIPLKRIDRAVAAARLLPDVEFNIYGVGPEENKLKRIADGAANIHFRGYTNDIDAVFRDNSILLITSEYEGYPISGIEACVHGRPVIVLNTFPASADLVENGVNGFVLDNDAPDETAKAVRNVFSQYNKYGNGAEKHRMLYHVATAKRAWIDLLLREPENDINSMK